MLIFDLGMHSGTDTEYYLARGYDVIAVEANPALCSDAEARFPHYLETGKLKIENVALADHDGTASFFISAANSEWSSLDKWRVDDTGPATEVTVLTCTLQTLVGRYGVPNYIKCDIEGADEIFCRQLMKIPHIPQYVSVEGISLDWLALLFAAGYRKFKLVNQAWVRRMLPRVTFAVGNEIRTWEFRGASSGPFGADLNGSWLDFRDAAQAWLDFQRLKDNDPTYTLDSWFDFHASI